MDNSGHYTSYCKTLYSDEFYEFDDHRKTKMDNFSHVQRVVEKNCFILAYEKSYIIEVNENISKGKNMTKLESRRKATKAKVQQFRTGKNKDKKKREKFVYKAKKNEALLKFRKDYLEQYKSGQSKNKKYAKVLEDINEVPSVVCDCCYRLVFRPESVLYNIKNLHKKYNQNCQTSEKIKDLKNFKDLVNRKFVTTERRMCRSCHDVIKKGKISIYGPKDGLKFAPLSDNVKELTDLEERVLSPIIPYLQIRELKPFSLNTFLGAKGPVVNIQIDIPNTTKILPRKFNELSVQQIMLKRHLMHKSYYMYETVSIKRILDALAELKDTPIYKELELHIDENIFKEYDPQRVGEHINFIVNNEENKEAEENLNAKDASVNNANVDEIILEDCDDNEILNSSFQKEDQRMGQNITDDELKEIEALEKHLKDLYGREGQDSDFMIYKIPSTAFECECEKETEQNDSNCNKNDGIKVIAPGAGKKPTLTKDIPDYDEKCFPSLYGGYPLDYNREKISKTKRYKHQVQNYDRRYTVPKCLFNMGKIKLEIQLQNAISIACRMGKCKNLTVRDVLNPERMKELLGNDDFYRFMKKITLTPAYLEDKRKNIFAYFRQLGFPSFFLTLGPAESFWPELLMQLYKNKYNKEISDIDALNLPDEEKGQLVRNDPVLCVQFFERRCKKIGDYLRTVNNKVFGEHEVTDEINRREQQNRGFPHTHRILYNKDIPTYSKDMNEKDWKKLQRKIDSIITTEYDVTNPNMVHQVHMCCFTCHKYKKNVCRFKFPRYPVLETIVLEPLEKKDDDAYKIANENLSHIKAQMEVYRKLLKDDYNKRKKCEISDDSFIKNFDSIDDMLQKLNLTYDQYLMAIRSELKKATLFYKRKPNAIEINNYNTNLLNMWGANMDLQYILDCYAAAKYLFSYLLKSDSGLIRLLHEALNESKDANLNQRATLRKIANAFNNALILGSAQIADYILGTPVTKFSRACVFINTGPSEKTIKILKQKSKLEAMDEDDEDVFEKGLLDHYSSRSKKYEDLCLADFASKYSVSIKNNKTEIKERKGKPRVIRFVKYNEKKDPEMFYREQLMLYHPWQNLSDFDKKDGRSFANMFENLKKNEKKFQKFERIRESYNKNITFDEDVEKYLEEMRNENEEEEQRAYNRYLNDEVEGIDAFPGDDYDKRGNSGAGYAISIPPRIPKDEFMENMRMLNSLQRAFINEIQICCIRNNMNRLFIVQGTAGTGKSFLIKSIYQMVTKYFDDRAGNLEDKESCKVLLTGTTGVAGWLLGGVTYHSAFKFSKYSTEFSESVSNTIRKELRHMEVLIIDEVSMMPVEHLHLVDKRMQSIFGNHFPFGGKMVILVGDFLQLRPVKGRPIYTRLSDKETRDTKEKFENFNKDLLWNLFEMHELKEVVRQKDSLYIEALINIAYGCLTDEQVKYIKKREVKDEKDVPASAVHLFRLNQHVDAYNKSKLDKMDGNLVIIESYDTAAEENLPSHMKSAIVQKFLDDINNDVRIPRQLYVKLNIKYMIPVNLDILDGLVNGVIGTIKYISNDSKNEPFILWLDFNNEKIGKNRRAKYKSYQQNNSAIAPTWVPIIRECIEIQKNSTKSDASSKNKIIRKQFPLTISESMTVHKSQGQTFPAVCADFTKGAIPTDILFVLMSRCDYNGLFIHGNFERPKGPGNVNGINEINRLRTEAQIKLSFDTLESVTDGFVIIYQNINSYKTKAKYVFADKWYSRGDIVIFSEANVNELKKEQIIEDFVPIFPLKEHNYQSKNNRGLVIMAKNKRKITLHKMEIYEMDNGSTHVDLKSFIIDDHYIITGYKSPRTSLLYFKQNLHRFLQEIPSTKYITLIGDFNFESGKSEKFQIEIINDLVDNSQTKQTKFYNQLTSEDETTIRGTQIDVIFSSSEEGNGGVYPTYFSDHHAVFYRSKKLPDGRKNQSISLEKKQTKPMNAKKRKNDNNSNKETSKAAKKTCKEKDVDNSIVEAHNDRSIFYSEANPKVEFPNIIENVMMIRNEEPAYFDYYYLCCFNSLYHGFSNMYKNNIQFRSECKKKIHYSIFKFLCLKESLKTQHDIYLAWIQFLTQNFNKVPTFSYETPDRVKHFEVNMEHDAMNLFESFGDKSITGTLKSCHRQIMCSDCMLVLDDSYFNNIIMPDVQKHHFENFTDFIGQSLNQEVSCSQDCNETKISMVRYNSIVILSIRKDTSDNLLCFEDLQLQDLPQEIILPVFHRREKKIYRLEFIQNFYIQGNDYNNLRNIANQLGHYTVILNNQESFVEIDDLKIEPINRSFDFNVNPHTFVYFEVNNEEIIKSKVFKNTLDTNINVSGHHSIGKKLTNMCCFNSLIHGLIRLYRINKSVQKYVKRNTENIKLFPTLYNIINARDETERNNIWGQFLYDLQSFSKNFDNNNMFDADVKILENIWQGYFSYFLKCQKCNHDYLNSDGKKHGNSFLSIKVTKQNRLQTSIFLNLITQFFNTFGKRKTCKHCLSDLKIETGKFFIVHIDTAKQNYIENPLGPELNFTQLPQTFEINNNIYNLCYVLHYIPGSFHFTSKYKISNDTHLEIDDDNTVLLVDSSKLVNPKALIFVRKY